MNSISFTCQACHRDYEPDPAMATECLIGPEGAAEDDNVRTDIGPDEGLFDGHGLAAMDSDQLDEYGLTPETRDALLRGEFVETTVFLCRGCQDAMLSVRENSGEGMERYRVRF